MTKRPNMIDVILEKIEEEKLWEERRKIAATTSSTIFIKCNQIVQRLRARGIQRVQLPYCTPRLCRREIIAKLGGDPIRDALSVEVYQDGEIRLYPPPKNRWKTPGARKGWLDIKWNLLDFAGKLERVLGAYYG